jgi:hypothetical protein
MQKTAIQILIFISLSALLLSSCSHSRKMSGIAKNKDIESHIKIRGHVASVNINPGKTTPEEFIEFAKSLKGIKYSFGGSSKEIGFDCSGFVWYVFNHFNIKAPRTSVEYTNAGLEVPITESKKGDIILFTGSDSKSRTVGHMGFITDNQNDKITFIHSASGGGRGIMESQMSQYFVERFVKVTRFFKP